VTELLSRQAEWSEETANYEAAVEMYIRARRHDRALVLIARHGWWERLHALVRQLSRDQDAAVLAQCAVALRRAGQYGAAKEALLKLDDTAGLVDLGVATERWEDAALLAVGRPELAPRVHLPHARWLCARDRFEEARAAFRAGGRPDLARGLLEGLAAAAVRSRRFGDAAHVHYRLAVDALQVHRVDCIWGSWGVGVLAGPGEEEVCGSVAAAANTPASNQHTTTRMCHRHRCHPAPPPSRCRPSRTTTKRLSCTPPSRWCMRGRCSPSRRPTT